MNQVMIIYNIYNNIFTFKQYLDYQHGLGVHRVLDFFKVRKLITIGLRQSRLCLERKKTISDALNFNLLHIFLYSNHLYAHQQNLNFYFKT